MKNGRNYFLTLCIAACSVGMFPMSVPADAAPQQKSATKSKQTTSKKNTAKPAAKTTASKTPARTTGKTTPKQGNKTTTSTTAKGKTAGKAKTVETSADVKKKQEATQKEIRLTEQQIKENERSIKKSLTDLGKIEGEISTSKQKIATTSGKISQLNGEINTLQSGITANEKELKRLRDEYLKAVRKMRIAKKQKSDLAFVFASENFNQALRRMRYLRQFSSWKDRQTEAIDNKTAELKHQQEALAAAKTEQDKALRQQQSEQTTLQQQYVKQDAIVAGLRKNGEALRSHLAKKQGEANQLKSRISALIAEEQRRAEAERKAREEAERKRAEAARIAREKKEREEREAAERAEKERMLAQQRAATKNAAKAAEEEQVRIAQAEREKKKSQGKSATKPAPKASVAQESKTKNAQTTVSKGKQGSGGNYADARKRVLRNDTYVETGKNAESVKGVAKAAPAKSESSSAANSGAAFSSMKGSLPRPVSGAFRVTSRFGRQSLPDLPSVVYDNPGIDAETAAGASAQAVYQGKVSGVYMIPGYNTVVIVNHGNYYTVYGNISSPSVKVGDSVKAGQRLGALAPDEDDRGHSSIHFEVWRNREKLNPLEWIK